MGSMSGLRLLALRGLLTMVGGLAVPGWSQQQTAPVLQGPPVAPAAVSGSSVTGTVIFADTQHAARFAQVTLQAVASDARQDRGPGGFGGGSSARTGLDGTFTISNVAPGDYYVVATAPGYISERSLLQAELTAGATAADLAMQIPTVHVSADGSGSATVTLQRGGAIAGKLQWEDGSAAAGVQISVDPALPQPPLPQPLSSIRGFSGNAAVTDDRGAFRITGLAGGDYLLQAVINPGVAFGGGFGGRGPGYSTPVHVYAPGVFRKVEAKPISVRAGDERDDLRMVIDLRGLHTVSGHVSSAVAGANIVSGRASLTDSSDTSLQPSGTINANGDFAISYVPAGTYTLNVQGSTVANNGGYRGRGGSSSTSTTFKTYSQSLTVGDTDVTGLGINLVVASSQ